MQQLTLGTDSDVLMDVFVHNLPYESGVAMRLAAAAPLSRPVRDWLRRYRKLQILAQRWRAVCRLRCLERQCKQWTSEICVWGNVYEDFWEAWSTRSTLELLRTMRHHAASLSCRPKSDNGPQVAFSHFRSAMRLLVDINMKARCHLVHAVLQDWHAASLLELPLAYMFAVANRLPRPALMWVMLLAMVE